MALNYDELVKAQTAPGFDLATAAQQATTPITLGQMNPVAPITLSPTPTPTVQPDALVAGATASVASNEDYQKQLAATEATKSQKDTAMQDYINSLMGVTNKPADLLQAQKDYGSEEAARRKNQYKNLVETGNAAYTQLIAKENADMAKAETTSRSAFDYAGTTGAIQRQALAEKAMKAAEITMNTALYNAANGDLTLALSQAKDSVDAKYSVLENISLIKKTQLEDIYKDLTSEEKKTADALLRKQKLEDEKIAEEKARETNVASLMVSNSKAGILPTDTLISAAQKAAAYLAKTPDASQQAGKLQKIGTHLDESGNSVDTYGFVNEVTGVVTPYGGNGMGNANLGMTTGNLFGLPTYNTQDNNPGVNRPTRNNNPGNIKASATTIKYPGVVGVESTPAADGGNFLIFSSPQAGITAISQLLVNGSSYQNVTAEQAIKKYNGGGGYGAADLGLDPTKNFQEQLKDPAVLQSVASAIATHEGFSTSSSNKIDALKDPIYSNFASTLTPNGLAEFNKLNEKDKLNVQQLISGDALSSDIAKGMGGAKYASTLLGLATKVDPTFSENTNKIRYNFQKNWDNPQGKAFLTRTAINTAMGHLAQLKTDSLALDNTTLNKYNTIANMIKEETGNPAVTNFNYTLTVLASEIAAAYKGGTAPTDQETEQTRNAISASFSPKQLQSVIDQAANLLSSKITSLAQEYKSVKGKFPDEPIVQDYILGELQSAGVDTSKIEKVLNMQTNNPTSNQTVQSNGQTYVVGQVYNDGTANWTIDINGVWKKQ